MHWPLSQAFYWLQFCVSIEALCCLRFIRLMDYVILNAFVDVIAICQSRLLFSE